MNDYVLITDSTIDFTPEMVEQLDICVLPLTFTIDNKEYSNTILNPQINSHEFYNLLRNKKQAKTSQVSFVNFLSSFESYLKKDMDIIYISLSSGISGTYNSATLAANEMLKKYPNRKIIVIDSLLASTGEGFLVYNAVLNKNNGMNIDELACWIESNKLNICSWFTVDDLFYLKNGGRISLTTAALGTVLGIKPILHVDNNGRLIPMGKVRGRKKSLEELVNKLNNGICDRKNQTVFISHADCKEDAMTVADLIKQNRNVEKIFVSDIGPVIGSHSGPGTVAVFFFGTGR